MPGISLCYLLEKHKTLQLAELSGALRSNGRLSFEKVSADYIHLIGTTFPSTISVRVLVSLSFEAELVDVCCRKDGFSSMPELVSVSSNIIHFG